jgi:predicted phosphodiesterase
MLRRYNTFVKFLVVSDIHANWTALDAVLLDAEGEYDQIVCCGDLVGYNGRPSEVVAWAQSYCSAVIRGNHDKAVAIAENLEWFNEVARVAAKWTASILPEEQLKYLRELPKGPISTPDFQLWHGAPQDEDEYITNALDAAPCFQYFQMPLAFFGHTHLQGGFFEKGKRVGTIAAPDRKHRDRTWQLENDLYYMVNPGSVGQPRDNDPRAAYALYDADAKLLTLRRVEYNIREAAEEILKAGLPDVLAFRLFEGF